MAPDKTLGYHYPRAMRLLQLLPPSPTLPRLVESFQKSHSSRTHVALNASADDGYKTIDRITCKRDEERGGKIEIQQQQKPPKNRNKEKREVLPRKLQCYRSLHTSPETFENRRRRWLAVGLAAVIGARFLPAREYHNNESSIQEECETLFLELVLDRVSRAGSACSPKKGSVSSDSCLTAKSLDREMELLFPGGILVLLKGICDGEVTPWVKKICTSLGKKKRLKPKVALALQNIIKTSEYILLSHSMPIVKWTAPAGAWFLLSEVSVYLLKAVDWEFLHHHWQLLDKHGAKGKFQSPRLQGNGYVDEESVESNSVAWTGDRVFLLQTISNVSIELPAEPAADLAHNLLKRVEKFNMHSTENNLTKLQKGRTLKKAFKCL
ncbi:hypothetical protein F3Y22_tig00000218pilonHSYRG00254 [Hibiscus syriacus]|uniref:Uncharacterized protein n=1 Tax=Hibiscus syriacus TaxID=106335 RepID=A0A6A3D2P8_HIBSY|nr:hypothetical protein F3Y22_tig00000218pilonHSYRG00254 [Hibiscus syriacus]